VEPDPGTQPEFDHGVVLGGWQQLCGQGGELLFVDRACGGDPPLRPEQGEIVRTQNFGQVDKKIHVHLAQRELDAGGGIHLELQRLGTARPRQGEAVAPGRDDGHGVDVGERALQAG
jgi:hypothetical protein